MTTDDTFTDDFASLLEQSPKDAAEVRFTWERRVKRSGLELPMHIEDPVKYVLRCRKIVRQARDEYQSSLAYVRELLVESKLDFDRVRKILERNDKGRATFAKIEALVASLLTELQESP